MHVVIPDDYADVVRSLACFEKLRSHTVEVFTDTVKDTALLARRFADAEALVLIRERTEIGEELLEQLPHLKLISQTGRGTTHIDLAACKRRGVVVCAGSGSPNAPAELTWALVLAASRKVEIEAERLHAGRWQTTLGRTVKGRTLGILGLGKIGILVAGYGKAFGMRVIVSGREGSRQRAEAGGFEFVDRQTLFAESDVVSLHLRLTPETRGAISARELALMKPDALLVNTARAELIAPGALLGALQAGRPGFAAVDVYESEPATDDPLLRMDNVLCTPHLGYVEKESYELYFGEAFDAVRAFAAGSPINVVS
jgi:D-3-phosphoglycerate dehydrogenase